MPIRVGQRIPSVPILIWQDGELRPTTTDAIFGGRSVLLVCMPGAFTPTCSREHLPGYVAMSSRLRAQGIAVVCLAVNDPFVMHAWAEHHGAIGKVDLVPDGNAALTRALGLEFDASPLAMGVRCHRAALMVNDGEVTLVKIEPDPGVVTSTAAAACVPA